MIVTNIEGDYFFSLTEENSKRTFENPCTGRPYQFLLRQVIHTIDRNKKGEIESLIKDCFSSCEISEYRNILENNENFSNVEGTSQWFIKSSNIGVVIVLSEGSLTIEVAALSKERIDSFLKDFLSKIPRSDKEAHGKRSIAFWYIDRRHNLAVKNKWLDCPELSELAYNYPKGIYENLSRLAKLENPWNNGKVILWHGPAGTGKTTAIRALAREWKDCQIDFILQPDLIMSDSNYLAEIFLSRADTAPRLIIIEDRADLFSLNCRQSPAFSAILNLTDGLIGQGSKDIFLFTANETIDKIDDALIRDGRCLDVSFFDCLNKEEINHWCKHHEVDPNAIQGSTTIASLYAAKKKNRVTEKAKLGF